MTGPNVRRAPSEPGMRGGVAAAAFAPSSRRASLPPPGRDTELLLRQSFDLLDRLRRAVEARQ